MKEHYFHKSIEVGKQGEELLFKFIKTLPSVMEIKDVRAEKEYQEMDIDIIAILADGANMSLEIKTDTYDSGNLFYETMSCIETKSIGCMYKTKADFILYYFLKTDELYVLKPNELREWFEMKRGKGSVHRKTLINRRDDGSTYTSEGYAISKKYLEGSFEYYKKHCING